MMMPYCLEEIITQELLNQIIIPIKIILDLM